MAANPLLERTTARAAAQSGIAGTDAGLAQLVEHCDRLNLIERRCGSDFRWIVVGESPRRTVDRVPLSKARDIAIRENMGRASA